MDNDNIHAVSIATPNHWHALAAIWAMQAGKDVYVEKPVSHNVSEGRRIVEAARKYNKICQTGTQSRSQRGSIEAIEFVKSGKLGDVEVARGLCYKPPRQHRPARRAKSPIPATRRLRPLVRPGPAPSAQPRRASTTTGTGTGTTATATSATRASTRWTSPAGASARTNSAARPSRIGGRFGYVDDGETANTQVCLFDYGDAPLIFEVRGLPTTDYRGAGVGNVFHGTDGYLVFTSYDRRRRLRPRRQGGRNASTAAATTSATSSPPSAEPPAGPQRRHRRRPSLERPVPPGEHQLSPRAAACRCSRGRMYSANNAAARETQTRMEEHLTTAGIELAKENLRVGSLIELDVRAETIRNNNDASRMLTREYRKGYEVPARFRVVAASRDLAS